MNKKTEPRPQGRPRIHGAKMDYITVSLSAEDIEYLRDQDPAEEGVVSRGLRRVVARARKGDAKC